jgi:PAS domain S-box-containing protein
MKARNENLLGRLQNLSPTIATTIGLLYLVLLGIGDLCAPAEMTLALFYLVGVAFIGWCAGSRLAIMGTAFASGLIMAHKFATVHPTYPIWILVWNESARFLVIVATGLLAARAGAFARRLSDLVEERTAKLRSEAEQHKATAATLAETVERFKQVVNNITEVFWLSDVPKNQIMYISPGYERLWGRKCDELYRDGRSWAEALHPDDREQIVRRSLTDQARGNYDVEYRIIRPDGTVRWIRDRAFPVRNPQGEVYRIAGFAEDITERRRTRQVIQTQAAILENMAEGVVVTDEHGLIVQMNPAAERIWGYECDEVLGKPANVFSALPEPEAIAVMREVLATLQTGGVWRGIFKNRRKDGAIISCEAVISRLQIQGRVLMVAVEQDITERNRAEEALRQSEEALRAFLNAVPEPAMLLDENGAVLVANQTLARRLDVAENELVHKPVFDFLPPQSAASRKAMFDQVIATGKALQFDDARDDRVFVNWFSPVTDAAGKVSRVAVLALDMTERKRAEAVLQESEQKYRTLVETTGMGYLILDMQGRVLDANAEYVRLSGHQTLREILGRSVVEWTAPQDSQRNAAAVEECAKTGNVRTLEITYAGPNGLLTPIQINGTVVRTANGETIISLCWDITERKRAEQALREAHDKLEDRVRERTAELQVANTALSESEARLRLALEYIETIYQNAPVGLCSLDLNLRYVRINQRLAAMNGIPVERHIGRTVREALPHLADGTEAVCRQVITTAQPVLNLELEGTTAAQPGVIRTWVTHWMPLTQAGGRVTGVSVVVDEVTERKRAAEELQEAHHKLEQRVRDRTAELQSANAALRQSEERYRSLVNNLNVGVYRNKPGLDGGFVQANPALARMHGYDSVAEFQKVRVADLYQNAREREAFLTDIQVQGTLLNYELRLKKRDGTAIYGSVNASAHRGPNGEVDWIDGVIEDITQRKQAEQSLAEALELNTRLVSASTVGIAVFKASGQCVIANDALARIAGGTVEQLRQQNFRRLESWRRDGILAIAEAAIETQQPQEVECQSRTTFGRELTIAAHFSSFVSQGEQHLLAMFTDQTEAARAQKALRASEERYRTLAESSPDAIFILDRDIRVQYVNSTAAALWQRQPAQLIGLTPAELFQPETAQYHCKSVMDVFETGKPVHRDESLAFPVGDQWIEIRLAPLYGEQGAVTSVMGVCRDITERKRAEQRLAEALDLNQKIIAASTVGIAAYRASGECVFANEALARGVGGSVTEVLQGNFRRLESWQQSGLLKLAEAALSRGQAHLGEILATTRFGKKFWADCHVAPFVSNGQAHLLLMAVDISERKRAEESLKIQSLVLQNMAEGALLLGPDQTILFANSALESMFGYWPGELIGQNVAVLSAWSPQETASFNEGVLRATQQGGTWYGEYLNRRKDGTMFTSEARVSPLDLGGHVHYVSVQQDITERKRAEEALRQSEARIRAIITGAPVLLFAVDHDGIIRFEDGQAIKALGATPGANVGRPVKEVYAHIPALLDNARRALRGEAFDSVMEAGPVVLDCSYSPTRDQDGNLTGYIGVATNITERHRLERQLLEISDREQARIGQDIHDGLCQQLVSLAFDANALRQALSAQRRPQARTARRIATLLDRAITESRQLSRGLFPVRLETEGLPSALEELAGTTRDRFNLQCRFASKGPLAVQNSAMATHLYRIAQEAVSNAIKHSGARRISIRLIGRTTALELSVEDDGVGLSNANRKEATGMGLHIMEYRARTIGGTLRIGPGRRGGTLVSCCIPITRR